jgi:hypothetical protein
MRTKFLLGKPKGKRPLRTPRRRWADDIKMDLREISLEGVVWISLSPDRDRWRVPVNTIMNLQVP